MILFNNYKTYKNQFDEKYAQMVNIFTAQFSKEFCKNGNINREKLVKYNSGKEKIKIDFI